jgi:hypothetical protein
MKQLLIGIDVFHSRPNIAWSHPVCEG